jgi:hypothetical protein
MGDIYPNDGQDVADEVWIKRCADEGWVGFSKDTNVVTAHLDAIEASGVILFLLPDQSMSGREQIARYVEHRYRIALKAKKRGPRIYKVYPKSVDLFWP